MRDRLDRKGYQQHEIEETIVFLLEAGFLDDKKLSHELMRQATTNRMLGFFGIKRFLKSRGLAPEVIGEALTYDESAEMQQIGRLIEKRLSVIADYPEPKRTRSLIGFLGRRGYSPSVIRKALRNARVREADE